MSRTVDRRVVEMKFDNKQFESAVNQSRQSIRLMEKDLKLLDGVKALTHLDKAISSVDFTRMTKGIDSIKGAFSVLGTVGRSIINKLTTDVMNDIQSMVQKVQTTIVGWYKQIEQRGLQRAKNLENSAFKIEGLLKRSNLDIEKSEQVQARLTEMISNSVNDTAFGLDEASVAASTLASTFGTSEQGLSNIEKSLNAIAGVAGTTGAAYAQVSDIFTDVAGKGKAQALEFSRLSLLGINAQQEVANYINKDVKLRGKLNKILKENTKHLITAADVSELAGKKGAITADIFADAFKGFIDTAKEANNTLDGVTSNIGAAMGRLGALFIQPLIENEGPYVKFLQTVKDGISTFAKTLSNLKIPKYITDFFNEVIVDGTKHLKNFIDEFKKGTTPLNTFLEKLSGALEKLKTILSLRGETVEDNKMSKGGQQYKYLSDEMEANKTTMEYIRKDSKTYGKTISDFEAAIKKKHKNWSKEKREREAERMFMSRWNKDEYHSLDQWKEHYTKSFEDAYKKEHKIRGEGTAKQQEALKKYMQSSDVRSQIALKSQIKYNAQVDSALKKTGQYDKALAAVEQRMEETSIFGFDYLGEFIQGFKNILKGVGNIFKTLADAVVGTSGPLHDFFNMLSGGDEQTKDSRKSLNKFSTDFKNATEKFTEFTKNNQGFKDIITIVGKVFVIITRVVRGIWKIAGKTLIAFAPLLTKIVDALGRVFGVFKDGNKEASLFDDIVDAICVVVESLAKVLEWVWDAGSKAFTWIKDSSIGAGLGVITKGIIDFVKYIYDHWPQIWGTITSTVKDFLATAKNFVSWIKGKIQPVISTITPYLETFATKVKDLTNGFIDLEKPIEFIKDLFGGKSDGLTGAMGKTEEALDKVDTKLKNVKDGIQNFKIDGKGGGVASGGLLKGRFGFNLMPEAVAAMDSVPEMSSEQVATTEENMNNTSSFLTSLSNISSDIKNNVNPAVITGALGIIGTVVTAIIGFKGFKKTKDGIMKAFDGFISVGQALGSGIKGLGEGFNRMGEAFKEQAEAQKKLAQGEFIKSLAKLLLVIFVGMAAITGIIYAFYKMASTNQDALIIGIGAFVVIAVVIGALIWVISKFAASLTGSSEASFDGDEIQGPKGVTFRHGKSSTKNLKESAFKPLIAIAAIIGVFSVGVLAIAGAIKLMGSMEPDQLRAGFSKFAIIATILIGLVGIVLLVTAKMIEKDGGESKTLAKGIGMMFLGIAAILFAFSHAVTSIAVAMKLISLIPETDMAQTSLTFLAIGGVLLLLIGGVLALTWLILKTTKDDSAAMAKNLFFVLLGIAIIIKAFGSAVKTIIKSLAILAVVGKFGGQIEQATNAFKWVAGAFIALTLIVMGSAIAMIAINKNGSGDMKQIMGILAVIGAVMLMMGKAMQWAMKGVTGIIKAAANTSPAQMEQASTIIGGILLALVAIIAVTLIFVGVMAGLNLINGKTIGMMFALAGLFTVLGGLIIVVAYAAKLFGEVGTENLEMFKTSMIILGVILAGLMIFSVIAGKVPGMMKGVILVSVLMLALGTMFTLIGAAVYMVGKGVDLLLGSIQKLALGIMLFANMDDKTIQKGGEKLGKAFKNVLLGLVDGIIEFGQELESRREDLNAAVQTIFGILGEAINNAIATLITNILTRLSMLILAIKTFLDVNKELLITILRGIGDILWFGVIAPFLTDLGSWLWTKINEIIDWLATPENASTLGKKLVAMFVSILRGLVDGMEANRDALVEAVQNLIFELVNIIFDFFGLTPPFTITWTAKTSTEKAELEKSGSEVGDSLETGMDNVHDKVVEKGKSFIKDLVDGILTSIAEGLVDIAESWGNGLYDALHPDEKALADQAKEHVAAAKPMLDALNWANDELDRLMAHGMSKKAAVEQIKKNADAEKKQYLTEWQTNSPSKWTEKLGENIDQGLANGIKQDKALEAVDDTTEKMKKAFSTAPKGKTGKGLIEGLANNFKNALPQMQKVIENSGLFDANNFIIKPSLDLSNVAKDTDKMQGLFDKVGLGNVNAGAAVGMFDSLKTGNFSKMDVSSLANGFDSASDKSSSKSSSSDSSSLGSINFTQNNYSPKSLSQIDIYRQTENLLGKQSTLNSLASSVGLTGTNF